ncbi:histidine phosphatase family protein [Vallitalea guaymasensis]|uniref:Histidine phosphatase family protein n=1 Tax=Vallitalea guaymasensis TaxID=1185412 RepID=A0A8J8SBM9_9FIRM|nr:histidine phosphatase family protein [Vallitalea guaymasensis]QUH28570.1 histidine phosphatase family protein [Vallitalea guaymasensis]
MGKIGIIRHGETEWNKLTKLQGREDIDLNKTGLEQARVVGEYLKKYNWDIVFSSPLKRAKSTAKVIAETIGEEEVILEEDLIERDYGKASGMTLDERLEKYPDRKYAGMENWQLLRERVNNKVLELAKRYEDKNILIVSHGGAINSLLYTLSDGEYGSGITKLHMGSMSMLMYNGEKLIVEYFNRKVY